MRKRLYPLLLVTLLLVQCSQAPLSGTIKTDPDWSSTLYLIDPGSFEALNTSFMGTVVDSAPIGTGGHFEFDVLPAKQEPQLYELVIQKKDERFPTQLEQDDPMIANYLPLIYRPGEHIQLTAEASRFQQSAEIDQPSPDNAAMLELRTVRLHAWEKHMTGFADHTEEALLAKEKAFNEYRQALMDFANTTDRLYPALVAIRWASPTGDYERIPEFLYQQCQKWKATASDHPWVHQLCAKASPDQLPVLVGNRIPDYQLPMLDGDTLGLHALLIGKLNLLDLWASWCIPCRHENQEVLAPLWQEYRDHGLQIIGYGLETDPNIWLNAVTKDGASWPQASHLQGDEAPLFEALRIQTIPANFLIDHDGKVIAKNVHGEDLRKFVEAYLK